MDTETMSNMSEITIGQIGPPLTLVREVPVNPHYWCTCGQPTAGMYSPCNSCGRDPMGDYIREQERLRELSKNSPS